MTEFHRVLVLAAVAVCLFRMPTADAEPLSKAKRGDWPMWGGSPDRNMVSGETGIPVDWDIKTGKNILWTAAMGSQTYGNPVVAGDRIFVGTNNNAHRRAGITGDKGVIMCFSRQDGRFQPSYPKPEL